MKQKTKRIIRGISSLLFVCYLIFMIYVLFFAEYLGRSDVTRICNYNLIPFREIKRFWEYRDFLGTEAVVLNLIGNVLCFVPFGAIIPVLSRKVRSFFLVFLLSFGFSLLVETMQFITKTGSFDVDDLMLNTLGGALGFVCFAICDKFRRDRYGKKNDVFL